MSTLETAVGTILSGTLASRPRRAVPIPAGRARSLPLIAVLLATLLASAVLFPLQPAVGADSPTIEPVVNDVALVTPTTGVASIVASVSRISTPTRAPTGAFLTLPRQLGPAHAQPALLAFARTARWTPVPDFLPLRC